MGRRLLSQNLKGCKDTTNESCPFDVRTLHKRGWLVEGASGSSRWWVGFDRGQGERIGWRCDGKRVTLLYAWRGQEVEQHVTIEWTPCNYGGQRPWWNCPQCSRRVAVIYAAGKTFACRHCYNLCYKCQTEQFSDRALRQAFKVRERLGDDNGLHMPFPNKPKGMHWKTYYRLQKKYAFSRRGVWSAVLKRYG